MVGAERPVGRLQQFRFQFGTIFFQIKKWARRQSDFVVAVRQHNRLAATRLGDKLAELTFRLANGNRFHGSTLIFRAKSSKRLSESDREPRQTRRNYFFSASTWEGSFSSRKR